MHEVGHVGTPLPPAMERQMEAAAVDLALLLVFGQATALPQQQAQGNCSPEPNGGQRVICVIGTTGGGGRTLVEYRGQRAAHLLRAHP